MTRPNHPALEYLSADAMKSGPSAILAAPFSGLAPLPLELPTAGTKFREELWPALEHAVASPKRKEIVADIAAALAGWQARGSA